MHIGRRSRHNKQNDEISGKGEDDVGNDEDSKDLWVLVQLLLIKLLSRPE